ncbi:alkaline phosphatase D family protein [Nonomuraea sp. NPDC046570]|uniref:alkaline phosphatase D family protein n=1 Tax=Nonomuraea sp. NPDC046570 TaxID=3155255 RepID=UPI0033FC46D7
MPELVVGPMLRYVDTSAASIWVETSEPCLVTVEAECGVRARAETFSVHDHHYAIVDLADLSGKSVTYEVSLGDTKVWPEDKPSRIRLMPPGGPRRVVFGSCRTSVPHDAKHTLSHGEDVLRAYGFDLRETPDEEWPDLLLMLGDQVYADEPSPEMLSFIAARRAPGQQPAKEIADFEEYAELYRLAWTDPEIRWLLSTVPTAMIFDDHDLRDDWNTSHDWREKMRKVGWWRRRVVAGLGAYWIYQHLGNLSPAERAEDPVFRELVKGGGGEVLDAFAAKADDEPSSNRWSYARDLGHSRLIMVDTRCARQLTPGDRRMLDPGEWQWLEDQVSSAPGRMIIGSSIPFLLPEGVHLVQNWNEALCDGKWGKLVAKLSEAFRQAFDLEHWGAFRRSFESLSRLLVASGKPVLILSGDVHYSYVAKAGAGRIQQIVCSPIRNPLSRLLRVANIFTQFGIATLIGGSLARLARIPRPPFRWRIRNGPWFQNAVAALDFTDTTTATWYGATDNPLTGARPSFDEIVKVTLD